MIRGRVVGQLWAARKVSALANYKLCLVAVAGSEQIYCCVDTLAADVGADVLVSVGSGARTVVASGADNRGFGVDAAISQIIDGSDAQVSREA